MMNRRARKALERAKHGRALVEQVGKVVSLAFGVPDVAGRTARSFDGHTPLIVRATDGDGENPETVVANFRAQGAGGCGRSRMGRSERTRAGGLSFSRDRNANASRGLVHESADFPSSMTPDPLSADAIRALRERAAFELACHLDARDDLRAKGEATAAMLAARTK